MARLAEGCVSSSFAGSKPPLPIGSPRRGHPLAPASHLDARLWLVLDWIARKPPRWGEMRCFFCMSSVLHFADIAFARQCKR
jgi:hypothetical protein